MIVPAAATHLKRHFFFLVLATLTVGCGLLGESGRVSGATLFQDQFITGQTGNWFTETDELGQTLVTGESLVIHLIAPNTAQYSALQDPTFSDFALEVDATQLEGGLNNSFGVLFRMQGEEQFYRFEITGNGLFMVEKRLDSTTWERLTNGWQESAALLKGLNQTNRLRIVAQGSNLTFYANNQLLIELVDASYRSGRIALDASTFNAGGLRVAFDNVLVRQP